MRKHFLCKGTQPWVSIVRTECSVCVCSTSHTYLSSHSSGICAVKTSTTAPFKAAKEAPSGLQVKKHPVLMGVIMHTARFMRQTTHNLYLQSINVDHDINKSKCRAPRFLFFVFLQISPGDHWLRSKARTVIYRFNPKKVQLTRTEICLRKRMVSR